MDLRTANTLGVPHEAYREIKLPVDDKERADIIKGLHRRVVLVKNEHRGKNYFRGLLLYDENDPQIFYFERIFGDCKRVKDRMWINDLEGLMVEESTS